MSEPLDLDLRVRVLENKLRALTNQVRELQKEAVKENDPVRLVLTEADIEWFLTTEGTADPEKIQAVAFKDATRTWKIRR